MGRWCVGLVVVFLAVAYGAPREGATEEYKDYIGEVDPDIPKVNEVFEVDVYRDPYKRGPHLLNVELPQKVNFLFRAETINGDDIPSAQLLADRKTVKLDAAQLPVKGMNPLVRFVVNRDAANDVPSVFNPLRDMTMNLPGGGG